MPAPPPADPQAAEVVARVCAQGVSRSVAQRLVAEHGAGAVAAQLDALPHRTARDPAAILVASIRHAWTLPQRLRDAHEQARQDGEARARAAAQRAQADRQAQERQALEGAYDALPAAERAQIEAQARAALLRATCLALHRSRLRPDPARLAPG